VTRRDLLRTTLLGGAALAAGRPGRALAAMAGTTRPIATPAGERSRVALTHGEDHADLVFQGLARLKDDIVRAIGDRPVVIKPNNVAVDRALSATPAEGLEGILEFLKSIGKAEDVVIAESAANGPTFEGYSNYGYEPLARKYGARLVDLDRGPVATVRVVDQNDMRPRPVRVAKLLLDRGHFLISATRLKTHDRVVATLSLKNVVVGAPVKSEDFRWGGSRPGAWTDKPLMHGNGFHGLHYNLYDMARLLRPDLAVLDGYQGMEGNGPVGGTPVEHRVAVAGLDWLAADRVGVELMGIDYARMGYLNYCAEAGLGQGDLDRIEVLGPRVADHARLYRLHDNIDRQLEWMSPLRS